MSRIKLVLADVDGTLVTPDKDLTPRALQAVLALGTAGIAFAITSGRPPRGMAMLVGPLGLTTPMASFNGGMLVHPDLSIIETHPLSTSIVRQAVEAIERSGLDAWVYCGSDWFIRKLGTSHTEREEKTVHFAPKLVSDFSSLTEDVVKIVGVSDDVTAVARCEADVRKQLGDRVSAARSQPYYLDVTHPKANKGAAVKRLAGILKLPTTAIATMGDMPNDILMFKFSGLSIAMGNASTEVQHSAHRVTASNTEDGFAKAVEKYILSDVD